jgi:hypothetical protein
MHAAAKMKACSGFGAAFYCNADYLVESLPQARMQGSARFQPVPRRRRALPGRHNPPPPSTTAHLRTRDLGQAPVPRARSSYLRRGCPTGRCAIRRRDLGHYSLLAAQAVAGVAAARGRGRRAARSAAAGRRHVRARRGRRGVRGVPRGWRMLGMPAGRVRRARCCIRRAS